MIRRHHHHRYTDNHHHQHRSFYPSFVWNVFSLLCSCFLSSQAFTSTSLSQHRQLYWTNRKSTNNLQLSLIKNQADNKEEETEQGRGDKDETVEVIQRRLMEKGLSWKQSQSSADSDDLAADSDRRYTYSYDELIKNGYDRVPGCVATVYIRVLAAEVSDDDNDESSSSSSSSSSSTVVSLDGYADAVISRGLLSSLNDFLEQTSASTVSGSLSSASSDRLECVVERILEIDPESIADQLGVRSALNKGRNDGLANMMRIVQTQLRKMAGDQGFQSDDHTNDQINEPTDSDTANRPSVALLLSGGVDSSVALRLLQRQGYNVTPFYLKIWLEDELAHLGVCPWEEDVDMCRKVCDQVGVELQIISLQDEYHDRVMKHTLKEAASGRTPNPDILCNSRVKFGCFLEYLQQQQELNKDGRWTFDYIASGHYAQLKHDDNGIARLFRAPDPVKDQSYFLCALNQDQLRRLIFPIGHLEKKEVRKLAEEFQLPNRQRPDSQGLCFLGKVKFRDFLSENLGESPGDIIDAFTGDVIGRHLGVWFHTVGQRKGLGPFLVPTASAFGPWYVVAKDPVKKIVYASNKYDEEAFVQPRSEFHIENVHWISGCPPPSTVTSADGFKSHSFMFKIRHGPKLATGTLMIADDAEDNSGTIKLNKKDGGLAPGQYVVFYDERAECLGGGIISERHWAKFLLDSEAEQKSETVEHDSKNFPEWK